MILYIFRKIKRRIFKQRTEIDLMKIPADLHDLIPLITKWNIKDDVAKEKFISESSDTEKEFFMNTIETRKEQIRKWIDSFKEDKLIYETRQFTMILKTYYDLKSRCFEYSVNLDIQDLENIINLIAEHSYGSFSDDDIENFISTCKKLNVDEEAVFLYDIRNASQVSSLTIIVAMDDIDSPDLYIYINNSSFMKLIKDSINSYIDKKEEGLIK